MAPPRRLARPRHAALVLASAVLAAFLLLLSYGPEPTTGAEKPARQQATAADYSSGARATSSRRRPKPLYWGATIGEQLTGEKAPWDMGAVRKLERIAGKGMSLVSFYIPFADCSSSPCEFYSFPTTPLQDVRAHGAIPMISWSSDSSPPSIRQPAFQLSDLIRGRYDHHIRTWATRAREWGHPFFLRFDWEMNGFWFPWGANANGNRPKQFVRAWRHVHRIFDAQGARNATWVWCPNVDFTRKLVRLERLYPGDRFVDWTCIDGFNWGNRADSAGWMSFDSIFRSTYRRVVRRAPRKPVLIGEVGSTDSGGSKAAWIRSMLRVIPRRYPKVRGFAWFDVHDRGTNWPIETSGASRRAFRRGISRPIYRANTFGDLARAPISPPGR